MKERTDGDFCSTNARRQALYRQHTGVFYVPIPRNLTLARKLPLPGHYARDSFKCSKALLCASFSQGLLPAYTVKNASSALDLSAAGGFFC
jgi:hypothetical protein